MTSDASQTQAETTTATAHDDPAARTESAPAAPAVEPADLLRLQPRLVPRADGLYYVSEILSYQDQAFVDAAYASVLRRPPAEDERRHTLADLRGGAREKIDILRDLARSAEGKSLAAFERIAGLKQSRLAEAARGLPVVGHLWRILAAVVRLPLALRHQRQFEAYALAQQQLIADHFNARERRTQQQLDALRREHDEATAQLRLAVADASAAVSLLSDAMAELSARHSGEQSQFARRLDAQQEFLLREQQAIVEAQKAVLASAEEDLRETTSEQRRELASVAARVEELRAAIDAARGPAGGKA